jgi:hypothetical protein
VLLRSACDRRVVVHELRLQIRHGLLAPLSEPIALPIAVDLDRRDRWLGHFEGVLVLAGALEDTDVIVREVLLRECHHIRLGDPRHAVVVAHNILPFLLKDERAGERTGAKAVVLVPEFGLGLALVVHDGLDQPILELALPHVGQLFQQKATRFFQCLALLGIRRHAEL